MAEKNMCDVCGSGNGRCGECGNMCGYRGNNLLRWFLGIIIIVWIFSLGMKFGEIKAYLDQSGYGRGGHMRFYPSPMMGGATWTTDNYTISNKPAETVQLIQAN